MDRRRASSDFPTKGECVKITHLTVLNATVNSLRDIMNLDPQRGSFVSAC